MNYKLELLGGYIKEVSRRNRDLHVSDVFSVTNTEGFIKSTEYFDKEVFSKNLSNYKIVSPKQFAYNPSRINVGSIDYLKSPREVIISPLYVVFSCNEKLHEEYLKIFLKSSLGNYRIRSKTKGAVRDTLSFRSLSEIKIPIPLDFEDQIRITTVLSKAEELIKQRKESIALLDELVKSVFLEMFGDPATNPYEFSPRLLSEFYINKKEGTKCGPFGSALKKHEYTLTGIPVWTMDNITKDGKFIEDGCLWINENKYQELENYRTIDGDIIISRAGTVGKMCVVNAKFTNSIISTNLIRVRFGKDLLPIYFVTLMKYFKERVGRLKTGAEEAFTHMSTGILDNLKFPYPSIGLQNQFAQIVERIESIKEQYINSLKGLENLYGSISQRAFKGELDLRKVNVEKYEHDNITAVSDEKDTGVKREKKFVDLGGKSEAKSSTKGKLTVETKYMRTIKGFFKREGFTFEDAYRMLKKEYDKIVFEEAKNLFVKLLEEEPAFLIQEYNEKNEQIEFRIRQ